MSTPAYASAEELKRVGVLKEVDNVLSLTARGFVPNPESDGMTAILGIHGADLIDTIDHNMTHGRDDARYQRQVIYEGIPASKVQEFRSLSARWSQRVLEELDRWLAIEKANVEEQDPTVRMGLGIYQIETYPSEFPD